MPGKAWLAVEGIWVETVAIPAWQAESSEPAVWAGHGDCLHSGSPWQLRCLFSHSRGFPEGRRLTGLASPLWRQRCCHPLFAYCPWEEGTSPGMSQKLSLLLRQPRGGHPMPSALEDGGAGRSSQAAACGAQSTLKCRSLTALCWARAGLVTLGAESIQRPRGVAPQWPRAVLGHAPSPV